MRHVTAFLVTISLLSLITVAVQGKKPPVSLVFPSKPGDVIFTHAAHVKREKGRCAACHDKLWPQSAKVPPKSSSGCATCHQAGGRSFAMKGNCNKCHAAGATQPQSP